MVGFSAMGVAEEFAVVDVVGSTWYKHTMSFSIHLWQRGKPRLHLRFAWTHFVQERLLGYGMVRAPKHFRIVEKKKYEGRIIKNN